jgi:hypothetical protein
MARRNAPRAERIATQITPEVAAQIKGMLLRGDRQSDIASFFQINQGRIYEVKFAPKYTRVLPCDPSALPDRGPYVVVSKIVHVRATIAEETLRKVMAAMDQIALDMRSTVEAVLRENA